MKRQTKIIIIIGVLVLLLVGIVTLKYSSESKLTRAVSYLRSHFNEAIGLICESEDEGIRTIDGVNYSHNQIYYLYSDNLLSTWALRPYETQISNRTNQTILSYEIPQSGLFEVLFGTTVPVNISTGSQLVIRQYADKIIMAEFHNSSTPLLWEQYGDTLIYQSLNAFLKGNRAAAEYYFNQSVTMWDGKGIYDLSTQKDGKYANYKLALILYASRVLNLKIEDFTRIEERLWNMQQTNGGITSLADLNGNPTGSANAETTAIALLPYNSELISHMQSLSIPVSARH
jgi:hypothetical protein